MTLQQMRYLLAIAECRSITAAAQRFFVSQSSLSEALREVERELGIEIFKRTNRGVVATQEGLELIGMVRRVVQQDDLIADRFSADSNRGAVERLSVSSQRYSFVAQAVAALVANHETNAYSFVLRETDTEEIFSDVRSLNSDLGILCVTSQNEGVITREIERSGLTFTPLVDVTPCAVVSAQHPIAGKSSVNPANLAAYPRVMFEQRDGASAYFYEDPLPEAPHTGTIEVRDRGTLSHLLNLTEAYAIGSGIRTKGAEDGIVSVPLETDEVMSIGYVQNPKATAKPAVPRFIDALSNCAHVAREA